MTASKQVPQDQIASVQPYSGEAEPMWFLNYVDELRGRRPSYWSEDGWWVLTDMAGIREAMQRPDVFRTIWVGWSIRTPTTCGSRRCSIRPSTRGGASCSPRCSRPGG